MKDLSEDELVTYTGNAKYEFQNNGVAWQKGLEDCAIDDIQNSSVVEIEWYRNFTK